MSLQAIMHINVDFYDKKYILINAKQFDKNSRFISVSCYSNGKIMPINAGEHSAYVRYRKPDNNYVFNACEINRKGEVLIELTEQMLAESGICHVELVLVNKGDVILNVDTGDVRYIDDASILSSMTFYVDTTEVVVENSKIESSYEYDVLNVMLEKAEAEYKNVILLSKSYAVGDAEDIRDNENYDNAKYYYERSLANANNSQVTSDSANTSATNARKYMNNAETYMNNASISATNAETYKDNAKTYADNAKTSETNAKTSEQNAKTSEDKAKTSETNSKTSEVNAKDSEGKALTSETNAKVSEGKALTSEQNSKVSETNAKTSETNAKASEQNSKTSETNAKTSEQNAKTSEINAKDSEDKSLVSETNAKTSEENALVSEQNAKTSETNSKTSETVSTNNANASKSYAVGGTGTRDNEDYDNAHYYYEAVKNILTSLNNGFLPMGTVSFAELASVEKLTGSVYNISDDFVTDDTFREGAGRFFTAGTNVYCTASGLWDCFGGSSSVNATVDEVKIYLGI